MNLWIMTSLLFTSFWVSNITAQGHFENCCLSYAGKVHQKNLFRHAKGFRLQEINESCNIIAVIFRFHRKDRVVCGNPKDVWVQGLMEHITKRTRRNSSRAYRKTVTQLKYAGWGPGKVFNVDLTHQRQQPIETYQSPEGEQDIW